MRSVNVKQTIVTALLIVAWLPAAMAHHSVAGRFDYDKEITLTGVIKKVDWLNPHIRIHFDVTQENGSVTTWMISAAPPAMLRKAGISKSKLMADGTPVKLHGILARDPDLKHIWVYRITYEDGHFYQMSAHRPVR